MSPATKKQRILGIDPGFGRTGFGIIEKVKGEWSLVDYGCIETSTKDSFVERIEELNLELEKVIKKYKVIII